MKKTFLSFLLVFSSLLPLQADLGVDQFAQISCPTTQTYQKALELCKEKGFSHFLIKEISYSDERGQTLQFKGVTNVEGGTLISETFTQPFDAPLSPAKINFTLICFKEAPQDPLAVDVQGVFDFIALLQNTKEEPTKETVANTVDNTFVKEIKNIEELRAEIAKNKGTIYLDCYSSYCPPCKMLAPKFDLYSKEFASKGTFLKINLDTVPEVTDQYKLKSIPTLIVFQKEKEIERKTSLPAILKYFESLK